MSLKRRDEFVLNRLGISLTPYTHGHLMKKKSQQEHVLHADIQPRSNT